MNLTFEFNKKKYKVAASVGEITGWNCGFKQIYNVHVTGAAGNILKQEELEEVVGSEEFGKAVADNTQATAFLFADNMMRSHTDTTAAVIGALMKSKYGGYMASPVYDNGKAHPFPDSLQMILIWWPHDRLKFVIHEKPFWRFPLKGRKQRLKAERERWKERLKGHNSKVGKMLYPEPRSLHSALKEIMLRTGLQREIPVTETKTPDYTKPAAVNMNEW